MSSTTLTEEINGSTFLCNCGVVKRSACKDEGFYSDYHGKLYCVLHFPDKKDLAAFRFALKKKLDAKDYNFDGVWFPGGINFRAVEFSADASFHFACFGGKVDFSEA